MTTAAPERGFSSSVWAQLPATPVWQHFARLCAVPRASRHEQAVREMLIDWCRSQPHLRCHVDEAGNLLILRAPHPDYRHAPAVILQGHMDMVCEKTAHSHHDFARDPIQVEIDGDLLLARDTTLGADNGIGVALSLAVLQDTELRMGAVCALFTVNEESGMDGASALSPDSFQRSLSALQAAFGDSAAGQAFPQTNLTFHYLLNLDSECWGELCIGGAGGMDVTISTDWQGKAANVGTQVFNLSLHGLRGGHSGLNIHLGRAHAIGLLAEVLADIKAQVPCELLACEGGNARNAIPRSAHARLAVLPEHRSRLETLVGAWHEQLRHRHHSTDHDLALSLTTDGSKATQSVLQGKDFTRFCQLVDELPHGVIAMSDEMPDTVMTSANLGIASVNGAGMNLQLLLRSFTREGIEACAQQCRQMAEAQHVVCHFGGFYTPWTPRPQSPLLARAQTLYQQRHGQAPRTLAIHAGLECGFFAQIFPNIDILSLGPTIHSPHAPGESVNIDSVSQCEDFLRALLLDLAQNTD